VTPKSVRFVKSANELKTAVDLQVQDIVVVDHIDASTLPFEVVTGATFVVRGGTRSVRVRQATLDVDATA
jgi:hypothetical protein